MSWHQMQFVAVGVLRVVSNPKCLVMGVIVGYIDFFPQYCWADRAPALPRSPLQLLGWVDASWVHGANGPKHAPQGCIFLILGAAVCCNGGLNYKTEGRQR